MAMQRTGISSTKPVQFWNTAPDADIKKPDPIRQPNHGQTSRGLKVTTNFPSNYVLFGKDSAFSPPPGKFEKLITTWQNQSDSDAECDQEIQKAFAGLSFSSHSNVNNVKKDQQSEPAPEDVSKRVILKAKTKRSCKNKSARPKPERLLSYPNTSQQPVKPRATLPVAVSTPVTATLKSGYIVTEPPHKRPCNSTFPVNVSGQ
ncbi:hypothetical protein [Endozoicomonas sp. SCSIO W0465]|uniref:hypothetical protein n=1 Tax=Endozoicomonas sp. SCSIO W0465 TaxID=2918516 RepID=UPI0020762DFA|nr:hypothetical protein [Endozoicomonas sp. SCSIO W0465]USE38167.1 hypothetical protein MJO57_08355 [Endozoicomonas sp. SCSIO W0465]